MQARDLSQITWEARTVVTGGAGFVGSHVVSSPTGPVREDTRGRVVGASRLRYLDPHRRSLLVRDVIALDEKGVERVVDEFSQTLPRLEGDVPQHLKQSR